VFLLSNKNQIDALPQDVLSLFNNLCERDKPLVWIASISKDGKPHIVPTCFVRPVGGNKIAIGGVFIKQTVKNLKLNSQIAMGSARFADGYDGYMLKGTSQVIEYGTEFEKFRKEIYEFTKGRRTINWMVSVSVEKVFSLKPKEGAKRIL